MEARRASRWQQGSYEVWILEDRCAIRQGGAEVRGNQAVLWVKRGSVLGDDRHKVIAYFEGQVEVDQRGDQTAALTRADHGGSRRPARGKDQNSTDSDVDEAQGWYGEFESRSLEIGVPQVGPEPDVKPAIFERGLARRNPEQSGPIRLVQFTQPGVGTESATTPPAPVGARRLRVFQRSSVRVQADWFPNPSRNEWIAVITSGVNLIVDGVGEVPGLGAVGSIDVAADRVVLWTSSAAQPNLGGETLQSADAPLEIYLEGNIVFRQGDRVIYADRMYYDVPRQWGAILNAELLTPIPNYNGLIRLKSDIIRQAGRDRFFADNTFITTSRLGQPGYRISAGNVEFEDNLRPQFNPFNGMPEIDPATGEQVIAHDRLVTSRNNVVYLDSVPVFYWPILATDLEDPTFFVRRAQIQTDGIFGIWPWVEFDAYELLGVRNKPAGTDWTFRADYLSERGPGGGTNFKYNRPDVFGFGGPAIGFIEAWAIDDDGLDTLGSDRRDLVPEEDIRFLVRGNHRQQLPGNFQLTAELGLISDRNFLEQYYEWQWDELKDQTTGIELKRLLENSSWSLTADARVNDFFTQTEWLRGDHFWLGQSLLSDRLTWFEHSHIGYARLRTASTPTDPTDAAKFKLLPWEADVQGERVATRQEIDLPLEFGPVRFVPFALGEAAHWGEVLNGDDIQRVYGKAGVRASIPFWAASALVESDLFNVHGLAHKIVLEVEASYSDASQDLTEFPLYDQVDDDAQEHFRRRFAFNTFGGDTPLQFDERFYAFRSGLQNWVSSYSTEIADDLTAVRMGARQRWQTKRGPPAARRIIDWIVLDTSAVWFPEPGRDNFGEDLGLVDYDFRWHVGDRTTLVSSGEFDFFDDGQQNANVGVFLSRPPRAEWFVGFRSLNGPIDSQVLSTAYSYRLSPKWILGAGSSVDVGGDGNIGQQFRLTRIGESFLTSLALNVDEGKDNVGVSFSIEPRFAPRTRLGRIGGASIPVAGSMGLE